MYQARGNTRPMAVATGVTVAVFFAVTVPLMLTIGTMGYAWGMLAATVAQLCVRGVFLRRLFDGFNLARHTVRALLPMILPVGVVLAIRLLAGGEHTGGQAIAEAALYFVLAVAATAVLERALLGEALGYLRSATRRRGQPAAHAAA
jgi:O-antigen/teichoic acid export membrane protein